MVELPSQPLANIDPEFREIALETGEWTYGLSGTSTREKLLLNLANDVCREHFGLAFRLHVQAALHHGVSFSGVIGVVRFMAPYAGYPAAADASSGSARSGKNSGSTSGPRPPERAAKASPMFLTGSRRAGKIPEKASARWTGGSPAS